ncbi:hypothetical protein V7266_23360 [Neobacillus drentensis]|uniref:hypothetical protein n=1 Tax=Neobacillus drentensis TaxID=220684 RepID=UPI0030007D1B
MFDPTAFDNMKVVIEGALYDLDIKGDIIITDRNDLINLAKMSRSFDVAFHLPEGKGLAKIELKSTLINLAAELLPSIQTDHQAGCYVRLEFVLVSEKELNFHELKDILLEIWGNSRNISLTSYFNPLDTDQKISTSLTVEFGRLVTEDQMDDLVNMTGFVVTTLERINIR